MAQRNIDFGTFPNDPDADAIRTAFEKVQLNFTELFSGLQDQAVLSVNRTPGQGITVSAPTGNVVVNANIACVRMTTNTLSLGLNGANGTVDVTMTNSTNQNITIDLPSSLTGLANATFSGTVTANALVANNSISSSNTITATGNLTSGNISTGRLTTSGNITTTANIYANSGTIGASLLTGALTTATQPNITTLGTLSNLNVAGSGNSNLGNVATANYFSGDGSNLTGVIPVTGPAIANGTSNINIPAAGGNINISRGGVANVVVVTGSGANISGTLNANGNANVGNIGAEIGVFTGNISAVNANAGNLLTANFVAGVLTTNAQPNITSVGTLTSLAVTGNVTAGNIVGTLANGNSNVSIPAAAGNVSIFTNGTIRANFTTTGANISGTFNVTGNANVGNLGTAQVLATANVTAPQIISNVSTGTAPLVVTSTTRVANLNVDYANVADFISVAAGTGNNFLIFANAVTGNVTEITSTGLIANLSNNSITATTFVGALSGAATSATTAGTVTTAAQPNITSVGTLTSLGVNGTVTAVAFTANTGVFTGNGSGLSAIAGANVTGTVSSATTAGTVTTAAQPNITSVGSLTALTVTGNANVGNLGTGGLIVATGNVTGGNLVTGGALSVTGNATIGNVFANSGTIGASLLTGTLTTNAQPNITSVGTLSTLSVSGNLSSGNANLGNAASANFFVGDGSLLTNITVGAGSFIENGNSEVRVDANSNVRVTVAGIANVLTVTSTGANIIGNLQAGNISATSLAGNLTTAAQPDITSVGTLSALNVAGVSNLGPNSNVIITGGVANAFLRTNGSGNLTWDTATLVPAQGANTQVIFNDGGSNYAGNANLTFNKSTGNLAVGGGLTVTNSATFGNVYANSGTIRGSLLTGTLTTAAQPNITSVGTLTSLIVNGNINAGNVSGGNLITANFVTGTLTTAAQPNITSVGTLTSLGVNNTITAVNITANTGVFTGNANGLNNIPGANVTGTVANATFATSAGSATTAGTVTTNAQPNITSVGTLTSLIVNGNAIAGNVYANSGTIGASLLTGTLTTAAQPNITSVGTLTSLGVNGTVTAVAFTANTGVFTGNGSGLSAIAGANVTGAVAFATTANAVAGANVSGTVSSATTAGTVTTNAQPNITSVGTLTTLNVSGNANVGNLGTAQVLATANITAPQLISNVANGTAPFVVTSTTRVNNLNAALLGGLTTDTAGSNGTIVARTGNGQVVGSSLVSSVATGTAPLTVTSTTQVANLNAATAGTVTTAAQPNITSVGTLTSLGVNGTVTAVAFTANTGVFTGNGSGLSAIAGANVTGTVSSATSASTATTAGTVTTAAQPNITSTGTLTSLTVSGNITAQANVTVTGYRIRSVGTGITAAGSTQGTATAITKEMNVVSTVATGAGVVLPTAVAGMVISITNTSANALLVYPATSAAINTGATNASYSQPAGATLQFIAPTTTQWYTVGATYA
jgi:hypothetical protein